MSKHFSQRGFTLVLVIVFAAIASTMLLSLSVSVAKQQKKSAVHYDFTEIKNDLKEILLDNKQYWNDHSNGGPDAFIGDYIKRDLGYKLPPGYMFCQGAQQSSSAGTTLTVATVPYRHFHLKRAANGAQCRDEEYKPPNSYDVNGLDLQYEGVGRVQAEMRKMAYEIKKLHKTIKLKRPAVQLATSAIEHQRRYGDEITSLTQYGDNNYYTPPAGNPNYYDSCLFCVGTACDKITERHGLPCITAHGRSHTKENFKAVTDIPIFSNKKNIDVWGLDSVTFSNKTKTCNTYTQGAQSECFILRAVGPLDITTHVFIAG